MLIPIILAGGSGSRLWPVSRQLYPKQFINLTNRDLSFLQETLIRLRGVPGLDAIVICNEDHRFLAAEQMREFEKTQLLLEPASRNTAPALTIAALEALELHDDPLLLVLPADHSIDNVSAFHRAIEEARPTAQSGYLVAFGVQALSPETGFGYIKPGPELAQTPGELVADFVEKPNFSTAEELVANGMYMWNTGIFIFQARLLLSELGRFRPTMLDVCQQAHQNRERDLDFIRVDRRTFLGCPSESIDHAIMENTNLAAVIRLEAGWSDIGSWGSLWQNLEKDTDGNVIQGDVMTQDVENSLVRAEGRLVAVYGLRNTIVVETKDAVLVAEKQHVSEIGDVVESLEREGRSEHLLHNEVYRPWGAYELVSVGDRHKVKHITVKPGEGLSVQMHHHRAEHWVVVRGTARVRRGDSAYLVTENQSTFIPVGEVHSLENPGVIPLEMIEVQSGGYLEEDDIVRIEDRYGRTEDI